MLYILVLHITGKSEWG